mmetsp:Transcript_30010/g.65531  ORF Transcript_30010/g.65531 Transcript_30010/m.65531 type:complete len:712 (+) Transcript_30010:46-2181(+)
MMGADAMDCAPMPMWPLQHLRKRGVLSPTKARGPVVLPSVEIGGGVTFYREVLAQVRKRRQKERVEGALLSVDGLLPQPPSGGASEWDHVGPKYLRSACIPMGSSLPLKREAEFPAATMSIAIPDEALPPLPMIVDAPTSVFVNCGDGEEPLRVPSHSWLVVEPAAQAMADGEAYSLSMALDAGGGTMAQEDAQHLQVVAEDRLNATAAEANFRRAALGASLVALRHAALALRLINEREELLVGELPSPTSAEAAAAEAAARLQQVESIVAHRAAEVSRRPAVVEIWRRQRLRQRCLSRASQGQDSSSPRTGMSPPPSGRRSRHTPRQSRSTNTRSRQSSREREEVAEEALPSPSKPSPLQRGLQALEEFLEFTRRRFGNSVRLWFMLDPAGTMKIGEKQFQRGCEEIGFRGNSLALWKYLDRDLMGHITLLEISPSDAILLAEFKVLIQQHFGGSTATTFKRLDDNFSSRVFKPEFKKGVRSLGYKKSAGRLFDLLCRQGQLYVKAENLAFLEHWNPPAYLACESDDRGLKVLKDSLSKAYDNMLRAWTKELDQDKSMRVSWEEFKIFCRRWAKSKPSEGLPETEAQIAAVWRSLDDDCSGWIALREFDPPAFEVLASFKRWAMRTHGGVRDFFRKLDSDNEQANRVTKVQLRKALKDQGLDRESIDLLYEGLDADGDSFLSEADVRYLDKWDLLWEDAEAAAADSSSSR